MIDCGKLKINSNELLLVKDNLSTKAKGYLVAPASGITEKTVSIMVNAGRSLILAAVTDSKVRELGLYPMSKQTDNQEVNFTISVEARKNVTTGISAADRAETLNTLAITKDPKLDLVTPGHIFPVHARKGGVLLYADIAEAASDLMHISGLGEVAAYCDCLNENGDFQDNQELDSLANKLQIRIISIQDIIQYRLANEEIVALVAEANLPLGNQGMFKAYCFKSLVDGNEHLALVKGDLNSSDTEVLVRVQVENKLNDIFNINDAGNNKINKALELINQRGKGVLLFIKQSKFRLTHNGKYFNDNKSISQKLLTLRENGVGSQILHRLGIRRMELISSSNANYLGLEAFNLTITKRLPI